MSRRRRHSRLRFGGIFSLSGVDSDSACNGYLLHDGCLVWFFYTLFQFALVYALFHVRPVFDPWLRYDIIDQAYCAVG